MARITVEDCVDHVDNRFALVVLAVKRARHLGQPREAIWFGHAEPVAERVRLAYRVALDEYNGRQRLQMVVEAATPM